MNADVAPSTSGQLPDALVGSGSALCPVCNHRVRVRKDGTLAKHAAQYATTCPNSGSEVAR